MGVRKFASKLPGSFVDVDWQELIVRADTPVTAKVWGVYAQLELSRLASRMRFRLDKLKHVDTTAARRDFEQAHAGALTLLDTFLDGRRTPDGMVSDFRRALQVIVQAVPDHLLIDDRAMANTKRRGRHRR